MVSSPPAFPSTSPGHSWDSPATAATHGRGPPCASPPRSPVSRGKGVGDRPPPPCSGEGEGTERPCACPARADLSRCRGAGVLRVRRGGPAGWAALPLALRPVQQAEGIHPLPAACGLSRGQRDSPTHRRGDAREAGVMGERVCVCVGNPHCLSRFALAGRFSPWKGPPGAALPDRSLRSPLYLAETPAAAPPTLLTPGRRSLRGVKTSLSSAKKKYIKLPSSSFVSPFSYIPVLAVGAEGRIGCPPPHSKFAGGRCAPVLPCVGCEGGAGPGHDRAAAGLASEPAPPANWPRRGGSFCSRCARR